MIFESLWNEFAQLPEVEAIALGGSRASAHYDEKSDYNLQIKKAVARKDLVSITIEPQLFWNRISILSLH